MFDNEEKQLQAIKSKIEGVPIPNESLNDAIQQGFLIATAKQSKRKKTLWTIAIAAVLLLVFVTSIRVSPAFANAISSIPGMGKIVELIQYDKGIKDILTNDYYQPLHVSQMKDDLTLTINGAIVDETGIVISYTLEAPYSIKDLNYNKVEIYNGGKKINPGALTYNDPNQKHKNRREDLITILFAEKQTFDTQDFILKVQLDNAKETSFSLPFTLPKEVKKGKVYPLNKVVEVEGQKILIHEITIHPLRVEVKLSFNESNSMKVFNFMDMRLEDEKGEVWSSIMNGISGTGVGEQKQTFYLQSNYFEQPKKLYFKFNRMQALPLDESYLLVDLQKKEVLKQPSIGGFEVTKMTVDMVEVRFPAEKERFGYFMFFSTENADGESVENNELSSWQDEQYEYTGIYFTMSQLKNPIKINFSAYPNYINGDVTIELK